MINELLLIGTLLFYFAALVISYKFFGRTGVYGFTVFAVVVANVEVLMLVNAFGLDQTLGNVMFAVTYSAAKILSENEGEKGPDYAKKAAWLSVGTTGFFMIITQTWAWYTPVKGEGVGEMLQEVFANSPRIMLTSLAVYAICMMIQIWSYKFVWMLQKFSDRGQWFRAITSTLFTQIWNTVLFAFGAFLGVYPFGVIVQIIIASYAIFIITSLWDMIVQLVTKHTCGKNHNILFKGVDE